MFTKEDLLKYQGFKKVISGGDFKIKGEAALMAASLFLWFNELEKKILEDVNQKPVLKPVSMSKPIGKE